MTVSAKHLSISDTAELYYLHILYNNQWSLYRKVKKKKHLMSCSTKSGSVLLIRGIRGECPEQVELTADNLDNYTLQPWWAKEYLKMPNLEADVLHKQKTMLDFTPVSQK